MSYIFLFFSSSITVSFVLITYFQVYPCLFHYVFLSYFLCGSPSPSDSYTDSSTLWNHQLKAIDSESFCKDENLSTVWVTTTYCSCCSLKLVCHTLFFLGVWYTLHVVHVREKISQDMAIQERRARNEALPVVGSGCVCVQYHGVSFSAHPWDPRTGLKSSPHGHRAHLGWWGCPGQRPCHVLGGKVPGGFSSFLRSTKESGR